jgi:hypothetical protein
MADLKNHWQAFDSAEPLLVWQLRLPAPAGTDGDAVAAAAVDEALDVLAQSGLLITRRPLPAEEAVFAGEAPRGVSVVTVRDARGALVDERADDAGALLRRLEGPGLDAGYARRFAAPGRPFVAAWQHRDAASVELRVAFFSTLHFDARDAALHEKNHARVIAARDGLLALARRRGGRIVAPPTPSRDG